MVIKVYISTITFSQEVKKNQQRALMILESKNVPFVTIDITDPGQEDAKEYMTQNAKPKGNNKVPMTPQIFNDAEYCGDFDDMDMANECDTLGDFLKMTEEEKKAIKIGITSLVPDGKNQDSMPLTNGVSTSQETFDNQNSEEKPPAAEEPKESEDTPIEVNDVPPVSVPAPAETAIKEEERTEEAEDQPLTKDVDGEVETEVANEEVNDEVIATEKNESVPNVVEEKEEAEVEEEEEEEEVEEEVEKSVPEPSA